LGFMTNSDDKLIIFFFKLNLTGHFEKTSVFKTFKTYNIHYANLDSKLKS